MAREDKPLILRPVDEDAVETVKVVRLENRETESREKDLKPIRLGAVPDDGLTSRRLDLPSREEVELRTHQPGIDLLIEAEAGNPDLLEQTWGEESTVRNPIPWGWFALIGLVIAGAVIWSVTRVEKAENQADQIRVATQTVLVDDEKEVREATQLINRIEQTLGAFFEASTVEALAPLVRHPERVMPLIRSYYTNRSVFSGKLRAIKALQPLTIGNRGNFWIATIGSEDRSNRNLVIEIDESGAPRIDWETYVCHQPMDWDEFANRRPAGESMDFRVYVEQDSFYSHEFADSKRWISIRLTALGGEETLFGYIAADSGEAEVLMNLLQQSGGRPATLILRLLIPEGLVSRRGAVIEKVVSPRWLYIDSPDSGS
jgi:hypothetical protein